MMCETMANVPVEEKSAYVLTEDMIDAAMNEQVAYQEDLESEEEESLPEENADHNSQESCVAENERTVNNVSTTNPTINIKSNVNTNTNPVMNISPSTSPNSSNNEVSVLVIETGLDKNGTDFIKTVKENPIVKNSNESLNSATDVHNTTDSDSTMAVNHSISDSKADLTILKSILSDSSDREGIIDLCESEADDYSEEEDANETETIDDELSSVMETNLMAEIGITMNKKTDNRDVEKISENTAPRISVKNISQISAQVFNSLPQNGCDMSFPLPEAPVTKNKMNENQCMRNINFTQRNPSNNSNIPITAHNQSSGAIHINKIAVPHSSFVNSQGQRMKCVYVKSTSNLPFVINTPTQTTAANMNTNVKYVMTQPIQQVKKPVQMPAIAALKNLTKNIQPQTLLLKNNTKLLMAQKLQRPPVLQTQSSSRSNIKKDAPGTGPAYDAIKNSLIYSSSNKKTHVPPDTFPEYPTYKCLDCNDKFLFKSSLANHIERRTMNIRYWCPCCKHELHFYNKCSLWIHLRGHSAVRHFDPKHLTITPISKDMLQKGIVSSYFFKITDSNTSQSVGSQSFQKSTFLGSKATQTNSLGPNSADSKQKTVSIGISNMINNKITTVAGQSKSICFQSGSSSEISRPTSSPVSNTLSSTKILPLLLPKPPNPVKTVALVRKKSLPIHEKEATARSTQTPPKSLIVFCNKLAPAPNAQQISVASPATPNAVSEAKPNVNSLPNAIDNNDTAMVIDDDVSIVPNNTEEEEIDVENVDGNVNNTAAETEKSLSDKGTKNTPNSSPSGSNKRTCSECKSYCVNISKHLNGSGRPVHVNLACKICNLILPSKCALKIHHRIHMKISPYKCPDCGKDFTSWDDLHAHLKFSCGHFAKCVRFICKGCKAHFPSQNGLAQHIVKNHGKDIFKCSLCPVAFYKKHSLIKHIETDHQNEKNKSRLGLDYKQCEMCPKKLLPEESYLVHAKEHSHTMIYGYKCSMCNIVYANKMAFIIHQIKEKKKRDQESMGKSEQSKTVHDEEPVEEPLQVSDSSSDYEDEPLIIRKYPEAEDGSLVTEKDPLSLDDWEYAQEQKVKEKTEELCIVCKKNSVILLPGIDRNRQSSCCKECVKPLDDDSSTELNKGSKKIGNSYLKSKNNRQNNPKSIYRSSSMDEVKKSVKKRRISDISLNSPFENDSIDLPADSPTRKKNRKKQKGKSASKAQTHIQGQVIRSRSLDEFSHKCSKCEFVTENREFFLEHISVHRNDPNTYQCLECGLSFVVLPSLERHLQMHHGIKDVRSYTENNKASLPQKSVPVEEDTQENQCRVCYEIFDCQSSLDKHFRIHGMAFMSRLSKSP